jgi:hypothetical protein
MREGERLTNATRWEISGKDIQVEEQERNFTAAKRTVPVMVLEYLWTIRLNGSHSCYYLRTQRL